MTLYINPITKYIMLLKDQPHILSEFALEHYFCAPLLRAFTIKEREKTASNTL